MSDAAVESPATPPTEPGFTPARPPRFWRLKRFLVSLNPLHLLFGPVFQRDVRSTGRRKMTYITRLVVLGIPTAFVTLVFLETANRYSYGGYGGSAAARIQSLQDTALSVARTIAWCQLITLSLVAPLLTAGCVVEERIARTLSAIAASPLSPGRVIGGLFASRMLNLALLALLPLPLILAIRMFGGLETSFIAWSFAIAVCNATALAAVGLWLSTRASRPAGAIMFAMFFLIAYWAGGPLIVMLDSALHNWGQPSTLMPLISSPPAALFMLQEPPTAQMFGFSSQEAAATNCVLSLGFAALALLLARWNLARLIATDGVELVRQPSRRERRRSTKSGETPADAGGGAPADDGADHSRTIAGNPVLWRELRQSLFSSVWKRWLVVAGIVIVVLLTHLFTLGLTRRDTTPVVMVPAIGGFALLLLSAAAATSGAVTTELEARTWAVLLTTPLSTFQILLPKIAGALRRLWPAFLFVTLHLIACAAQGIVSAGAIPFTLAHFFVYAVFLCCTGVFFSLCTRKSAVASTLNIALVLALWLVGPIFVGIVISLFHVGGSNQWGLLLFTHPVFTYGVGLDGLLETNYRFDMADTPLQASAFFTLWLGSLVLYSGLAVLVMLLARGSFHRLSTARI